MCTRWPRASTSSSNSNSSNNSNSHFGSSPSPFCSPHPAAAARQSCVSYESALCVPFLLLPLDGPRSDLLAGRLGAHADAPHGVAGGAAGVIGVAATGAGSEGEREGGGEEGRADPEQCSRRAVLLELRRPLLRPGRLRVELAGASRGPQHPRRRPLRGVRPDARGPLRPRTLRGHRPPGEHRGLDSGGGREGGRARLRPPVPPHPGAARV
mmetsp:Transcript_57668/g.174356  ORF Transcript_57668/g.174356 Transcript_57668/m.174356 type:complete len:211 (-) Transcript_57668:454-1086(-)